MAGNRSASTALQTGTGTPPSALPPLKACSTPWLSWSRFRCSRRFLAPMSTRWRAQQVNTRRAGDASSRARLGRGPPASAQAHLAGLASLSPHPAPLAPSEASHMRTCRFHWRQASPVLTVCVAWPTSTYPCLACHWCPRTRHRSSQATLSCHCRAHLSDSGSRRHDQNRAIHTQTACLRG